MGSENESYQCPALRAIVDVNIAAVEVHDLSDDGEPQPEALTWRLSREEWIKYLCQVVMRDARPGVLHLNFRQAVSVAEMAGDRGY